MTQKSYRHRQLAQIHIARKALCLDEDVYRLALADLTGKSSCSDMDLADLGKVIKWFEGQGWKPKKKSRSHSPKSAHKKPGEKDQEDKIRALWIGMAKSGLIRDGSEQALGKWIQRMTSRYNNGLGYQSPKWVPSWLLGKLIEDLKQWQKRLEDQVQ